MIHEAVIRTYSRAMELRMLYDRVISIDRSAASSQYPRRGTLERLEIAVRTVGEKYGIVEDCILPLLPESGNLWQVRMKATLGGLDRVNDALDKLDEAFNILRAATDEASASWVKPAPLVCPMLTVG